MDSAQLFLSYYDSAAAGGIFWGFSMKNQRSESKFRPILIKSMLKFPACGGLENMIWLQNPVSYFIT